MSTSFDECGIARFGHHAGHHEGGVLRRVASWPARVLRARREMDMLAAMSAIELKDIGLTRSDVNDATALPASASPTDFLAARIEQGHRAPG